MKVSLNCPEDENVGQKVTSGGLTLHCTDHTCAAHKGSVSAAAPRRQRVWHPAPVVGASGDVTRDGGGTDGHPRSSDSLRRNTAADSALFGTATLSAAQVKPEAAARGGAFSDVKVSFRGFGQRRGHRAPRGQ